jgi:hypothetical protein
MRTRWVLCCLVLLWPACSSGDDPATAPADCESSVSTDGDLESDAARLDAFEACMEDRGWECETGDSGVSGCQRQTKDEAGSANDEFEYVHNPFDPAQP